jgi:hypothetical protein
MESMRSQFRGYYPPSPEEFAQLWDTGIVVLDTNVLLNMYRYTVDTRESLFAVLVEFSSKLWLPYQVALEYHQSRLTTIIEQRKAYENLRKTVAANMASLRSELDKYRLHPVLDVDGLISATGEFENALSKTISDQEERHSEKASFTPQSDDIRDRLTVLYEGRVGGPYEAERLAEIEAIGDSRYEADIPPGYADKKKPKETRYGDLILWMQLIEHAERERHPVIFITDDVKADWWLRVEGQTIGPRPELIAEMHRRSGQLFHMYRAEQFARYARDYSTAAISDSALSEIDHLAAKQEEERKIVEKAREVLKRQQQKLSDRVDHFRRSVGENHEKLEELREGYQVTRDEIEFLRHGSRGLNRARLEDLESRRAELLTQEGSLSRLAGRYADDNDEHKARIQKQMLDIQVERQKIEEELSHALSHRDALAERRHHLMRIKKHLEGLQLAVERDTGQLAKAEAELTEMRNLLSSQGFDDTNGRE